MNKLFFAVLIVLVIVGGIVWYSGILNPAQTPVTSNDNVEPGNLVPTDGSTGSFAKLGPNAIYVAEQRPGKEIFINAISIASPGYVVIHEVNNGIPGAIIGNSDLIQGAESKNIKVILSRAAKDGEELIAMLHMEKGANGFDSRIDLPVLGSDGSPIHMIFQVNVDAPDPSSSEVMF